MCACFMFLCFFFFACLLADIADKHQDAGQIVPLQISASLAGTRSAYQHRYVGLNSVSCILSAWFTSSNTDNTMEYLTNSIYCLSYLNVEL